MCVLVKKKKYRKFSVKNHPDKHPADGGEAFKAVNGCLRDYYDGEMDKLNEDDSLICPPKVQEEAPPTNVDPNEGVGTPQGVTKETNEDKEIKKSTKSDLKYDITKVKLPNGLKIKGLKQQ